MNINNEGVITLRKSKNDTRASILIAGDCCPRSTGEKLILNGESEVILEPVQHIFQNADLSIIQFETPLTRDNTPIVKSGPNLRCDPDTVDFLHAWGGDVTLLANNHIGDFGTKPVLETIDKLSREGFKTVGAGANIEDAYQPLIINNINGFTIGILNVAENEFGSAGPDKPGAAPLNPVRNIGQIRALAKKVDCCMVVTHGGNESNPIPSPRVVEMSRAFADAGADIVVNIHTHCPQGIEVWHKSVIVYSLGNFYFPEPENKTYAPNDFWTTGYLAKLQIDAKGVFSVQAIPTRFALDGSTVEPLTDTQRAGFYKYLSEISCIISNWDDVVKYHEAWASTSGYTYMFRNYKLTEADFLAPAPNPKLMPLRNIFTCEAHNEVVKTYLRLVEEGRVESAAALMPRIRELMKADYLLL